MSEQRLAIKLPSIVRSQEFVPTGLMIQTICAYLEAAQQGEIITPREILIQTEHSPANWYNWQRIPHFAEWWLKAQEEWHTRIGLAQVHHAMYKNATGNSAMDRKLFLERFDKEYKPQTKQEFAFDGAPPPEEEKTKSIDASKQRATKFIESKETTAASGEHQPQKEISPVDADLQASTQENAGEL